MHGLCHQLAAILLRMDRVLRFRQSSACRRAKTIFAGSLLLIVSFGPAAFSQRVDTNLYSGMRWRQVGPFRAGRVSAVAGIPGNAAVYYMGTPGGGVWKTVDGGMVWFPIS